MREHAVSWESMENTEKMENINQINSNTLFMIRNTLIVTQNTLFGNQMTQNTAFNSTVEKITTSLGEHDPGSAQKGKTSSEMYSPASAMNHQC